MRRYGEWAGNPRGTSEDVTRCEVEVSEGGRSVLFHQCDRKRVGVEPYPARCRQHSHPRFDFWVPK